MCIDSQSVKTTEVGGTERGYDGGKKINGRKRHVLVDTMGLLLVVLITSAASMMGPPPSSCSPNFARRVSAAHGHLWR